MLILSLTGLVLWPGWRKLVTGFKIKWQAHIKRVNFDIYKVAGVVAVVFLAMISFTDFCWNFYDFSYPVIYAATFSPKPPDPLSKPIAGKLPLGVDEILQKANAALPGAKTTYISLPTEKEGIFKISKKFPQDITNYQNRVYLDQYSGEVLWLQDSLYFKQRRWVSGNLPKKISVASKSKDSEAVTSRRATTETFTESSFQK